MAVPATHRHRVGHRASDFTTWDLKRLFAHIDAVFGRALAEPGTLQQSPIADFDALLEKGTVPDKYRPTLYDFVAQQALTFYTAGEQAGARPEDAFELPAASPVLDETESFVNWELANDAGSPAAKALRLYQDLLRFHARDDDPSAFADVDLARLSFGHSTAFGEEKAARYKAALKRFVDRWADHELSAQALERWARVRQQEGDWVEAHALATRGRNAHPTSPGGQLCINLIAEIEAKSARILTERVWNLSQGGAGESARAESRPRIEVVYRNVDKVFFQIRPGDWEVALRPDARTPERLRPRRPPALAGGDPAARLVSRSAAHHRLSGAGGRVLRAHRVAPGFLLPGVQPPTRLRGRGQPDRPHGILGQRPGVGDAFEGGPARRLCARRPNGRARIGREDRGLEGESAGGLVGNRGLGHRRTGLLPARRQTAPRTKCGCAPPKATSNWPPPPISGPREARSPAAKVNARSSSPTARSIVRARPSSTKGFASGSP